MYTKQKEYPAFRVSSRINLIGCQVVFPEKRVDKRKYNDYYTFVKNGKPCTEVETQISK